MMRIRDLGVDLLGARNAALRSLVTEAPPPLVAEMLGYSYAVTQNTLRSPPIPMRAMPAARSPRTEHRSASMITLSDNALLRNQRGSRWLFPGTRAGHHITAQSLMHQFRTAGIDIRPSVTPPCTTSPKKSAP